jgi:CRISPR-associated protein Cas2
MFLVVAYDISDDRRRDRLAKELENWGQRVQGSVFECDLDEARTAALIDLLNRMVKDGDDLRVYHLCQACLNKSVVVRGGDFAVDQGFYQV